VYELIHEPEGIRGQEDWEKLSVIGKCYSERTVGGKTTSELRYFIGRPALLGGDLRRGVAEPLADGELFTLAIGCDVWRGCQPDSKTSWGGEFRIVASVGIGLAQATSR
jgi:hypothetical protein